MSDSMIVYNKPTQEISTLPASDEALASADLTEMGLPNEVNLSKFANKETFALVFDGSRWISQTYMEWEDLRINEALQAVKANYSEATQGILTRFVASMGIKYQGKKSWVALLNELGKEIEGR